MSPRRRALIIVDFQHDFVDGSLAVADAREALKPIRAAVDAGEFNTVITTQDWHPERTNHFRPNGPWPVHCVQNTIGADLLAEVPGGDYAVRKGDSTKDDGYSGFDGTDDVFGYTLDEILTREKIKDVYVVGLAQDYCVKATALDAVKFGYVTYVPLDTTRAVAIDTGMQSVDDMKDGGVEVVPTLASVL